MTSARTRAAIALFTICLMAAGCRDSKSSNTTSSSSSSTSASTSQSSSSSSSASTTTTTAACSAPDRPAGAVRVSEGTGDFNGDGTTDHATVYGEGTDAAPAPWRLLITLGAGKGQAATVISASSPSEVSVSYLGASALAESKAQGAFVNVGFGASDSLVGIFTLSGCDVLRVSMAGTTTPAVIPIGGAVTHLDGARCANNRLTLLSAESNDGLTYQASAQRFVLQGASLVTDGDPDVRSLPSDSPDLQAYATLDCPGVTPP